MDSDGLIISLVIADRYDMIGESTGIPITSYRNSYVHLLKRHNYDIIVIGFK